MEINKVYNEDCLITLAKIPDCFIDLTITSPPYNLGKKHHTGKKFFAPYDDYVDDIPEHLYQLNQIEVLNEIYRVTKEGGSILYNHKNRIKNGKQISPYEWLMKTKWDIKQEVVWQNGSQNFDKCRFYPMTERIYWLSKGLKTQFLNTINSTDIINDTGSGTDWDHKRAFPLSVARKLIMCFPDSQLVYDPYMGSGTTSIACLMTSKQYIGSEISNNYYNVTTERIERYHRQPTLF